MDVFILDISYVKLDGKDCNVFDIFYFSVYFII